MNISGKYLVPALTAAILLFSACGNEWDKVARTGNTWEYELDNGGTIVVIRAEVQDTYKIGKRKFAELNPNKELDGPTLVYGWDADAKAITYAGRSSSIANETNLRFFVKETIIGHLKNEEDRTIEQYDGSEIVYRGEEKIEVPAGSFDTLKFDHKDERVSSYWYATGTGPVQIEHPERGTLKLKEFVKGKDKPITLGAKNADKALDVVKAFYLQAAEGNSVDALFTAAGTGSITQQNLKKILDNIKKHNKPYIASIAFTGENSFNLRFLLYTEAGGEPNVERTDVDLVLVDDKGFKIDRISAQYTKLMQ